MRTCPARNAAFQGRDRANNMFPSVCASNRTSIRSERSANLFYSPESVLCTRSRPWNAPVSAGHDRISACRVHENTSFQVRGAFARRTRSKCPSDNTRANMTHTPQSTSSSLLGPADPSFQALAGRLKLTVRRHKFNEDSLTTW